MLLIGTSRSTTPCLFLSCRAVWGLSASKLGEISSFTTPGKMDGRPPKRHMKSWPTFLDLDCSISSMTLFIQHMNVFYLSQIINVCLKCSGDEFSHWTPPTAFTTNLFQFLFTLFFKNEDQPRM